MAFDREQWKQQVQEYFAARAPLLKQAGTDTLYGLLAVGALLPAVTAYQGVKFSLCGGAVRYAWQCGRQPYFQSNPGLEG